MPRNHSVSTSQFPTIRVVVLGERDVGKSALVVRFLTKRFIGEYASGKEMTYEKEVHLSGSKVTVEICDALINENQPGNLKKLSTNTDAYVLVYSICCRDSFDYACHLAKQLKTLHVKQTSAGDIPLLLVGSKSDLDHFREVKESEGRAFAESMTSCRFIETSAAESYGEVEKAFQVAIQLARSHTRAPSPPSVVPTRVGRKNSITQMAQLIRGHLTQHSRSTSLERGLALSKSGLSKENNPLSPEVTKKKKLKKYASHAHTQDHLSLLNIGKSKLASKCQSLSVLTEDLPTKGRRSSIKSIKKQKSQLKTSKRNEHDVLHHSSTGDECEYESHTALGKLSLSSDDTIETSDVSANEEEAFSSGASSSTVSPRNTPRKERRDLHHNDAAKENSVKSKGLSINKKNLHLPLKSHSEIEDKTFSDSDTGSPRSAPLVHSISNHKFRYYPHGLGDNQELSKGLRSPLTTTTVPMSPLLNHKQVPRVKSPKEEKKSPAPSFLKHFFKTNLHSSTSTRSLGSNLNLNGSQLSQASSEMSLFNIDDGSTITLSSLNSSRNTLAGDGSMYCRSSSTSLSSFSSIINDENTNFDPFAVTCSAPSTPQMRKDARLKGRRSSIREAVGSLMRKRKQSLSIDCLKYTSDCKERVL